MTGESRRLPITRRQGSMHGLLDDNMASVGRTPLVKLNAITRGLPGRIAVKIEGRNPAYSVKCRAGTAMILAAEREGILRPGSREITVIEPTSGNTGIALAYVCAARGYPLILTMPDSMSLERRKMLRAFGAQLVLTPGSGGMRAAIEKAKRIVSGNPAGYYMPKQFENPANPGIHFSTTGPEIRNDTGGKIDVFVAGVGTGGTVSGVGRYLKIECRLPVRIVAVEPEESAVLTAIRAGRTPVPAPHPIQGIGAGFKPVNLDMDILDEIVTVSGPEAIEYARRMHREEGITCGISGGAAVAAACRYATDPLYRGKLIVTILPDSGERYLSTRLFEEEG